MEDAEYRELEEQALRIVDTLNKLKEEIEDYRDAKIDTRESLESLSALLDAVSGAAKELSATSAEVRDSDYVSLHDELSEKVEVLSGACDALQRDAEAFPGKIDEMLSVYQEKQDSAYASYASELGGKLQADIDARDDFLRQVTGACENIASRAEELPAMLEKALSAYAELQEEKSREMMERVAKLEQVVFRIDRNTQKGFGKERG